MAGIAIADVLVGEYNPSGKLTVTFQEHPGQIPLYYSHYNEKYLSKYLDGFNEPLYTFGYGLSYTTLDLKNLKLSDNKTNFNQNLNISVEVSNTGKVDGEETVQLYIRPVIELKGFEKVFLQPGEKKEVHLKLCSNDLRFYNLDNVFATEQAKFEAFV